MYKHHTCIAKWSLLYFCGTKGGEEVKEQGCSSWFQSVVRLVPGLLLEILSLTCVLCFICYVWVGLGMG